MSRAVSRALRGLAGTERRRNALSDAGGLGLAESRYPALALALDRQRLLPLLGARAVALGGAPEWFAEDVERAGQVSHRVAELQGMVLDRVLTALGDAGVAALPLKGVPLSERLHGGPGFRVSTDIDLLVGRRDLAPALDALAGHGFVSRGEWLGPGGLPLLHRTVVAPGLPAVEVHWRAHWYEDGFAEAVLARAVPEERWRQRPDPVDEGLLLLLFHARDGLAGLRLPADAARWWDLYARSGDLDELSRRAREHGALTRALTAAWDSLEQVVGLPPCPWATRRRPARIRLAVALTDPDVRSDREQIAAERSLVDGLLTPPGDLGAFVRRALLPPAETIRERLEVAGGPEDVGPDDIRRARLAVPLQILGRYGLALLRRVRPGARPGRPVDQSSASRA